MSKEEYLRQLINEEIKKAQKEKSEEKDKETEKDKEKQKPYAFCLTCGYRWYSEKEYEKAEKCPECSGTDAKIL